MSRPNGSRIARAAFRYRSSAASGFAVRNAFAHASRVLPVRRVAESEHVLAFRHPVPGFAPVHVLLVPKLALPTLMHLTEDQRAQIAAEVESLAPNIIASFGRAGAGFLVVVNGGGRQDVRQVHFHLLVDGYALAAAPVDSRREQWTDLADSANEVHEVRRGTRPLFNGLVHAAETSDALALEARGYSVVWDARTAPGDAVHLTAG
jgi:histidine triad (HIT) family protein